MTIKYRLLEKTTRGNNFFRNISDNYPMQDWHTTKKQGYGSFCHWGQRKLLFSEIEFLSLVSKKNKLEDFYVVYIGAASGMHQYILKDMFPKLKWLLYDPAKFAIKEDEYITIKNEYATDDSIPEILKITKGYKILFISDIRVDVNEERVYEDMIKQQRWAIMLNSFAIMLKFRLPYTFITNKKERNIDPQVQNILDTPRYDPLIKDKLILPSIEKKANHALYLDGQIQTQINPPLYSSETRLICFSENGKYKMRYYDCYKYESQLLYFNNVDLVEHTYKYHESEKLKEHLIGYDDGYSSVAEYLIIEQYFNYYKKINVSINDIIKQLYFIDYSLYKLTNRSLLDCNTFSTYSFIKKEVKNIQEKNEIIKQMKKQNKIIYQSMIEQKELFQKWITNRNGILTKEEYQHQIDLINKLLKE